MAVVPASDPAATRQRLLDAAWRVLTRHGDQPLSLDAVAREAEVSKGGLLHHFPTRASLIDALYDRWNDEFDAEVTGRAVVDDRPGSWVRAYLDVSTEGNGQPGEAAAEVGVLAALIADPNRLRQFRERYDTWQSRIVEDRIDPALATLVRMAADGMWLADLLGLAPPTGDLRGQLLRMLRELTVPPGQPSATPPVSEATGG
ncbi:TetR family transcriptional regulator [Frankia sp. CcI49]|uniref:DNA-binding transcriptional regulator, AcrR family n=1 Tax=Parafrankia irregularis TaxID=795642 RepID=A0A0S4QER9_9ACTN|nr:MULTISPECIES: TetR/AcrR family transcriptional regulator [Frankiaceae]KPM54824.1 TetR family transcriptional regulator [Frankia sp. R43]MBE3206568.1 TetR family transcriptional regulator [Parafrankia sp. CH37]ONH61015.1 TetR family transcriptional regulator [Frankia sp. CcI49]CUU53933.1 DNA-binding transcriptional regulator, AcrR family [Parafrankia irregularis]